MSESRATSSRPIVLFVLGMGRSGTSALTRVLSLSGCALPAGMMGADARNPRGYWEPRAALNLNEEFLFRQGSSYFDPTLRLKEDGVLSSEDRAAFSAKIVAYFKTLPSAPVVVIKDLHVSVLCDIWFDAARLAGFDIATVIAVRHPNEVVASLAKFMKASPELTGGLWLKYNLLAERDTRALPRVFVEYSNLLKDWRREVERIAAALSMDFSHRDEEAIEEFLQADLRRQQQSGPVIEPFGADWVSSVYEALGAASRDEPWDKAVFDRVFAAYQATEHGFRTALDDFNSSMKNPFYRLSRKFLKPTFELVAMANRRNETWA